MSFLRTAAVVIVGAGLLSGCVQANNLNRDFGSAYHEHIVAQIADPDAHYVGDPAPGSDGARVASAQERYRTGKVIKPTPATTSRAVSVVGPAAQ